MVLRILLIIGVIVVQSVSWGQGLFEYSDTLDKSRRNWVWTTEGVGAASSLFLLNAVWYKNYPRSPLHSFNDNHEWLQMDKVGHAMTSYYVGLVGTEMMKWSGEDKVKSIALGSTLGFVYLTGVELLDGTSAHWGFSWGDMMANASGTILVGGQEFLWNEQRIKMKVSSHLTTYALYRPNVLGSTTLERMLKDYNGQTYWLSMNLKSMFFKDYDKFPSWLNFALGYGAEEMVSGSQSSDFCVQNPGLCGALHPYRQYYLSLDVDLTKIEWNNKALKTIFGSFGWIKIPAPTVGFGGGKTDFYWFYF